MRLYIRNFEATLKPAVFKKYAKFWYLTKWECFTLMRSTKFDLPKLRD